MKNKIKYIVLSLIIVLLMIIATKYDLQIDKKINNSNSVFALTFQIVGEIPVYAGFIFFSITFFHLTKDKIKMLFAGLSYVSIFLLTYMPLRYLIGMNIWSVSIIILISLLLYFLVMKLSYKIENKNYKKMKDIALMCGIGITLELLTINAIKLLWSRVRFFQLDDEYSMFTPWYICNWFKGNYDSFPSGHTAGATNILYLTLIPTLFIDDKKKNYSFKIFAYAFIIATAYSRLVLGKHYLSDVVIGFTISYIIHKIMICVIKNRHSKIKSI